MINRFVISLILEKTIKKAIKSVKKDKPKIVIKYLSLNIENINVKRSPNGIRTRVLALRTPCPRPTRR